MAQSAMEKKMKELKVELAKVVDLDMQVELAATVVMRMVKTTKVSSIAPSSFETRLFVKVIQE